MKNAKKLIQKIQQQKIVPTPKWHYVLKNIAFWILLIASVVFGGLSLAMILFVVIKVDIFTGHHFSIHHAPFLLKALPFFWIIALSALFFLTIVSARHTKKGYRYSIAIIFGLSLLLNVALGVGIYKMRGAEHFEKIAKEKIMFYKSAEDHKKAIWSRPDKGFLAGEVQKVEGKNLLIIRDLNGQNWQVDIQNAPLPPNFNRGGDYHIKLKFFGIYDKENNRFRALKIRPWQIDMHEIMHIMPPSKIQ